MLAVGVLLLLAAAAYMALLFAIASFGDRRAAAGRSLIDSSVVYALSLAVYCTSWTFYGSVGRAASRGLDFLPIYLGPTLVFCLGWVLLSRILRVSKAHRITSIADLLASRFGKSGAVAGLVTIIAVIVCLPRQFQVMVVENVDPRHLDRALWLFPAYLIAINLFVVPIALAGLLSVPAGTDPDTLMLALPLGSGYGGLALLAFLGGLSAAASMVIVETVALSTMICNDLAVPMLLRLGWLGPDTRPVLLGIRRAAIALVVLLGFAYVRIVRESYGLVSIGLVSFAAVAQFFPAIVLGLFWKRASRLGVLIGISAGFLVWGYTLLLPSFASAGWLPRELFEQGALGISVLRPSALFGLDGLDPVTHGLFWSMLLNIAGIIGVSLFVDQSALERSQAALFVDYWRGAGHEEGRLWRGTAQVADLVQLVGRFLGEALTREAFAAEARGRGRDPAALAADAETVRLAERLLAGAIGSAAARERAAPRARSAQGRLRFHREPRVAHAAHLDPLVFRDLARQPGPRAAPT